MRLDRVVRWGVAVAMASACATSALAQGPVQPTFTYQGRLQDNGAVANGIYDLEFKLFDTPSLGNQVGVTVTANNVGVIDGVVTIELAFGAGSFNGQARWLEIGVRPGPSTGAYTVLTPRQAITTAPYSMFAMDIPGGRIPQGAVMYFNLQTCPAGWSEVLRGRGRYVVGLVPGGTPADTVGTALGGLENRPVGQHAHSIVDPGHRHGYEQAFPNSTSSGNSQAGYRHADTDIGVTGITVNPAGGVPGTNAPYIVLLLCQKD